MDRGSRLLLFVLEWKFQMNSEKSNLIPRTTIDVGVAMAIKWPEVHGPLTLIDKFRANNHNGNFIYIYIFFFFFFSFFKLEVNS